MITLDGIPAKADGILERSLNEEIVVLSPKGDVLHTLADTSKFIWSMIDGTRSAGSIAQEVTHEYEVDESAAKADLLAFLDKLLSISIITIKK